MSKAKIPSERAEPRRRDVITLDHIVGRMRRPPLSVAQWAKGDSSIDIIRLSPNAAVIVSRGPGRAEAAEFYAHEGARVCAEQGSVVFWDAGALTSNNLDVLATCIDVGKANRHNLARVHIYYDSPLVGMAITVANLPLGGLIHFHRQPETLLNAFNRFCARFGSTLAGTLVTASG